MKATLFAVFLSLFVAVFPVQAEIKKADPAPASTTKQTSIKININKADVQTLTKSVKGIGLKRAQAIVAYREKNGRFKSIDDLAQVRGIGKQFVKNNLTQLQNVFVVE